MMRRAVTFVLLCMLPLLARAQAAKFGFRISGRVVHAVTGAPIAGVRLQLGPTAGAEWARVAIAGADGRFSFDGLKAGKYRLNAEYPGFVPSGFDEREDGFLSAVVTGGSVDSEHLVFRLEPSCSIAGVVTDEFNESVREARVMLFHRAVENGALTTHISRQMQTNDRGAYRFFPLKAGTYFVVVSGRPWYAKTPMHFYNGARTDSNVEPTYEQNDQFNVAYPTTFYSGTTEEADATSIELHRGEGVTADVSLRSVPAASLRVLRAKNEGAQPGSVYLSNKIFDQEAEPVQAQTYGSSDGYVTTGFAPGKYEVHVVAMGEKPGSERIDNMDLSGETTLDLATIKGAASAKLVGIARAEGVELKNAFLLLRDRDSGERQGDRIAPDGKFKVDNLPPGKYEVSVGNSAGVYVVNMAASGAKVDGRLLTVPSGADVSMAIILAKGVGEIEGTAVRGERGVSGVLVLLVPENPDTHNALFRRDQSDSDGSFKLLQVVPGRYTLLAIEDGWDLEWTKPDVLKPFMAKGTPVVVEPGGKYNFQPVVQPRKVADMMQAK